MYLKSSPIFLYNAIETAVYDNTIANYGCVNGIKNYSEFKICDLFCQYGNERNPH